MISALWTRQPAAGQAQALLRMGLHEGGLVICGPVYAELLALPGVSTEFVDGFLRDTGIELDLSFDRSLWQEAGGRFAIYATRRRKSDGSLPGRILADFLIGSHALKCADRLLTFNAGDYRLNFPELVTSSSAVDSVTT